MSNIEETWDYISSNWYKWKPPLKPCQEDIDIIKDKIKDFKQDNVLMLGVTPELANIEFNGFLTAVDHSYHMIKDVWVGNVQDKRQAVQADWFTMNLPDKSQDIVLTDDAFIFYTPYGMEKLAKIVSNVLKPDGLFIIREFIMPDKQETIAEIAEELKAGKIHNFHSFKFRVAMALQKNRTAGVCQDDIWNEVCELLLRYDCPQFSLSDKETLILYRDSVTELRFPTQQQFKDILAKHFKNIEIKIPSYEFGERCQFFMAQPGT